MSSSEERKAFVKRVILPLFAAVLALVTVTGVAAVPASARAVTAQSSWVSARNR
jgi:capsid protein